MLDKLGCFGHPPVVAQGPTSLDGNLIKRPRNLGTGSALPPASAISVRTPDTKFEEVAGNIDCGWHCLLTADTSQGFTIWKTSAMHTVVIQSWLCIQVVEAGRVDVLQKLIDFGVQVTVRDAGGNTPLHMAVKFKVTGHLTYICNCDKRPHILVCMTPCKFNLFFEDGSGHT